MCMFLLDSDIGGIETKHATTFMCETLYRSKMIGLKWRGSNTLIKLSTNFLSTWSWSTLSHFPALWDWKMTTSEFLFSDMLVSRDKEEHREVMHKCQFKEGALFVLQQVWPTKKLTEECCWLRMYQKMGSSNMTHIQINADYKVQHEL